MEPVRYSVGTATLVRVPYVDVLVDAEVVGLTPEQVAAIEWATPTWAEGDQVRVGAAAWVIESDGKRIVVDPAQAADEILRTGPDAVTHQEAVASALETAGYPRESIDTVIATHALHAQGVLNTVDDEHAVTSEVNIRWTGAHSPGHVVVDISSVGEVATMIGHLALSPLHCVVGECGPHMDPPAAATVLRSLNDGRVLVGPLWPAPGAVRWTGDSLPTAVEA